jgi:putative membrane protein insertion efficiency factor
MNVKSAVCLALLLGSGLSPITRAEEGNEDFTAYQKRKGRESAFYEQTNPLRLYLVMLLRFYQVFISKQEGDNCQFRPSCSHFGALAIKQAGTIQGVLMTSDRLQRCNPFTYGRYPLTKDKRHHYDPVEDHILFARREKASPEIPKSKSQIPSKPQKDKK